ncbi:MAG: hypothetical protein ACRENP_07495 [Longimicrobiales bacterium]
MYVDSRVSLNGRPFYPFIDPNVDLARQPRNLRTALWILSLPSRAGGLELLR